MITFVVSASATTILHSRQVRYKNDKSVEQAINELYQKAEQCGKIVGCSGCTKLEYLQSTGIQYIDTGYYNTSNTKVDIEFTYIKINGDGWSNGMIYGSADQQNGIPSLSLGITTSDELYYRDSDTSESFSDIDIQAGERYIVTFYQNTINVNDVVYNTNMSLISSRSLYSSYLFARHQPWYPSYVYSVFIGKIYFCKIYDADNLVRDYIPVLDNNDRPCLFDKVSKTCFYNQGTGEFLYG